MYYFFQEELILVIEDNTIDRTVSIVSSEIYYRKERKKNIFDFSLHIPQLDHFPTYEEIKQNYKDKMVERYGIYHSKVEPLQGEIRNEKQIIEDKKKGTFLGNEYIITELCQILPLYGLTFKRNEYFILWRDP